MTIISKLGLVTFYLKFLGVIYKVSTGNFPIEPAFFTLLYAHARVRNRG